MTNTNNADVNSSTKIADEAPKRYVVARDGNGNEIRHLNFENPEICPREGIITLQPMRNFAPNEVRHKANVMFSVTRDKKDNIVVGIPRMVDPKTKDWRYDPIRLKGTEVLDLSIESNAKKWAVLRLSPFLEGSPNLQGKPLYKVYDNQKQADNFLAKYAAKRKAQEMAFGLEGEQLTNMARVLGIAVEQNNAKTLKVEVLKAAEKDEEEFLKILNSPTFKYSVIFKKAVMFGIIEQHHLNGHTYRGVPMGQMAATEAGAIQWLSEHPDTANAIDVQCMQRENPAVLEINQTQTSNIQDEKDVKLAELEAQNKRMMEMIEKLSAEKIGANPEESEMTALQVKARDLGVKSPHMYKTKEKLLAAIKEQEEKLNKV